MEHKSKAKAKHPPEAKLSPDNEPESSLQIHDLELGEYFFHLYILETANLNFDGDLNAVIRVEGLHSEKYTRIMKGLGAGSKTFWGEHVFFQQKFDSREELENASFRLSVFNHNALLRDNLVGATGGSLLSIYGQEQHFMVGQWAILTNPEKDFRSPMGFVKYSVCFDRIGQRHPNLEQISREQGKAGFEALAIPPEIKLKSKQLTLRVFRGKNIVPMDFDGSADPYVKFDVGGSKIFTPHVKSTLNPKFYKTLFMPLLYPTVFDRLQVSLKDYDLIGKNESIGSNYYFLQEIIKGKFERPHWAHFYGGYDSASDKEFLKKMNQNPELGNRYKGALLLSARIDDAEEPKFTIEDMGKEELAEEGSLARVELTARMDILYVENLKASAGELRLCVKWGSDKGVFLPPVNYKRGVLVVAKSVLIKEAFEVSERFDSSEQFPDLILSVFKGETHLSFLRLKTREFMLAREKGPVEVTCRLLPDFSSDSAPEDKAGIVRFSLGVARSDQFAALSADWPELPPKASYEKICLVIHLLRAKDLQPADPTATSDPIVQFYHLGAVAKSSLFPETLNPSWNERLVLSSFLINGELAPIVVNVSDRDENFVGAVSYDFLGSTIVMLNASHFARSRAELFDMKPGWHDLSLGANLKLGRILVGVKVARQPLFGALAAEGLLAESEAIVRPLSIPKTKHHLKINILGLRNLQSNGILPVKSVSVKINTSSLKPANQIQKGSAFSNLTAPARNSGPNPSIGTVLSVSADLADDLVLMPTLSCQVLETSLSFLKGDSLIGTFQIELALYAYISKVVLLEKLKAVERFRREVKGKEKGEARASEEILAKINRIIRSLEAGLALNQSYIQQQEPEVFRRGEEAKEAIGLLTTSALVQNFERTGPGKNPSEKPNAEEILEKSGEDKKTLSEANEEDRVDIFEAFAPETNVAEGENLRLLSDPKITADRKSRNRFSSQVGQITAQEKVVIVPDKNHFLPAADQKTYMLLGYKSKKTDNRHFRHFVACELEETLFMGEDVYTSIDVFRGKRPTFEKRGFFARVFSSLEENYKKTGTFKGNVEIIQDDVLQQIMDLRLSPRELTTLEIPDSLDKWKYSALDAEMLRSSRVLLTLYVVSAEFFTSQDLGSENDAYLKVSFAGKTLTDSKVVANKNNPKFYRRFEFEGSFPGPSDLTVEFVDQDDFNADDLIGTTTIDAERRFFDRRWRSLADRPIETRKIRHPKSESPVGEVLLWLDIDRLAKGARKTWNIDPRPETTLELRVIVWEVFKVPSSDPEGTSDLYVTVGVPSLDLMQRTDTHLRSQNGFGGFNWRTVFKLKIDEDSRPEHFRANLRVFDKDLLNADDFIADATLDFSALVQRVLESEGRESMSGKSSKGLEGAKEFKVPLCLRGHANGHSEGKRRPYVVVSVELLSEELAKGAPAGVGRSDPNQDPFLPAPRGRFGLSMNLFAMFEQMMGPGYRTKIVLILIAVVLGLFVLIFIPVLVSTIISWIVIGKKN